MSSDAGLLLERIVDYCEKIESACAKYLTSREAFDGNEFYRDGCAFYIQQIGEIAKELPEDFVVEDEMPWFKIRGMRNIIAHAYDSVDPGLLWATIQHDIPKLKVHCEDVVGRLSG